MDRHTQLGAALVIAAAVLFVAPALAPVEPMLTHDTSRAANAGPDDLRAEGFRVVDYANLSERGQELYVRALRNDGEYRVPLGRGAPEFEYPTAAEIAAERDGSTRPGTVVIERPVDDGDLPPPDERFFGGVDEESERNETERRRQALRYDLMQTRTEQPPLGSPPQLIRLAAVLLALLSLGVGGYLLSAP